jgi:aminoacrylate hydrolase
MPQVEAYQDEYHVIIFDNRGVGKSSTPPGPYSVADMATDTIGLLDALGIARWNLSGSSLGGAIAMQVAIDEPDRTESLQLHSSWLRTEGYTEYSLGLLRSILVHGGIDFYYDAALPLLFSVDFLSADFERTSAMLEKMKANSATTVGLLGQLDANLSHDLSAESASIGVPTLVTVGSNDMILPVAASRELAERIPDATLHIFEGGAHLVSMEAAEEFNSVTLQWMRTHCR